MSTGQRGTIRQTLSTFNRVPRQTNYNSSVFPCKATVEQKTTNLSDIIPAKKIEREPGRSTSHTKRGKVNRTGNRCCKNRGKKPWWSCNVPIWISSFHLHLKIRKEVDSELISYPNPVTGWLHPLGQLDPDRSYFTVLRPCRFTDLKVFQSCETFSMSLFTDDIQNSFPELELCPHKSNSTVKSLRALRYLPPSPPPPTPSEKV